MRDIINTVLCPIDFSEPSCHALEHAAAIARWYDARLVGVHAYSKMFTSSRDVVVVGGAPALTERLTIEQTRAEVDAELERVRTSGLMTEVRVPVGEPIEVILKTAAALPADILVMGTHGLTGFRHLLLGSFTEKVLRTARCPVVTVPPRAQTTSRLPFRRIVCAVDFSEPSLAGLTFGYSIAQECDAELTILHVFEPVEEIELLVDRPMSVPEYWRYREHDAMERLARLAPDSATTWCTARTRVERGKPYRKILEVAAEADTDLIVMGVHGRNPLDMMLFGSTTNQVVRRATCPVLTLRS